MDPQHPKGLHELHSTRVLNDALLKQLGLSHYNVKVISGKAIKFRQDLRDQLKKYLQELIGDKQLFGIKDPRLGILLPLYTQVLEEMGYDVRIVMIVRKPAEVIRAWVEDRKQPKEKSLETIARYLTSMLIHSQHYPSITVSYDELLNDPKAIVERVRSIMPELKTYAEAEEALQSFISPNLKRYHA